MNDMKLNTVSFSFFFPETLLQVQTDTVATSWIRKRRAAFYILRHCIAASSVQIAEFFLTAPRPLNQM